MRQYIALIHKDPGSDYGVSFPDLPGCITAGVDLDDARRMAEEALALHLAGMAEDGEPIPESSSLEVVMAERENREAVAILVKAPPATAKAVRVNMTIPEDELVLIDKFAAEHGYTRSGFLLHAAKRAIDAAAGDADPFERLERLLQPFEEERQAEDMRREVAALQRAIEAGLTGAALRKVVEALLRNRVKIDALQMNADALQRAIGAGLTGDALRKVVEALLRNQVKADALREAVEAGLTGDAIEAALQAPPAVRKMI
jgi:predicted RNase H-like HicB family nuclease